MNLIDKVKIQNKGLGFVAKCDILKNTTVLMERKTISVNQSNLSCNNKILKLIYLINKNKKLWNMFLTFCPNEIDEYSINITDIEKIILLAPTKIKVFLKNFEINNIILYYEKIKRNMFELNNYKTVLFDSVFFNHSCEPNLDYYFDNTTNQIKFIANKNIDKNEELLICYNENSNKLKSTYGFECDCNLCLSNRRINTK